MKTLCYVLAMNVVLSAANNLDFQNNNGEAKQESRKIKHTISRIYSVPHTLARTAHNNINYNQIMKILKEPSLEKQQLSAIEGYTELSDVDTDSSKIKIQDESTKNNLNTSTFNLLANKNARRESDSNNIISKKETELNAETLNEIIQNLKASNVSNLEQKQIRKGKLVIYYDDDEDSSEVPVEINHVEKFMKIDDEIHNLFIQHQVPEDIFYTIKRRVHVEPKERTKHLFTSFVKYLVNKGQLNIEIINQLNNFIGRNSIDVDLKKLLVLKDSSHIETVSQMDQVTNVIKNVVDGIEQITEQGIQKSTKGTLLDLPIINSLSHITKNQNNYKPEEIADVVEPNSNILLRPNNEDNISKEIKIKTENKSGNIQRFVSEDILQTAANKNPNDKNDFEVQKAGIQSKQIPDLNNKDKKIKLSQDALNPIISPLTQNVIRNCTENDCEAVKKHHTFDFDALKMISKGKQKLDSSAPVLSNIPIEEYLNYKKRKPFFIYVMFSDPEKNSELSDMPTKIDPHFKLPDIETTMKSDAEKNKLNEENNAPYIAHMIKKVIENRNKPLHSTKIHSAEDFMDILSNLKESNSSDTSYGHSKNVLIDEIFENLINNENDLYPIIDHNEAENNIRIQEIKSLLPNINKELEYYPTREGGEKNVIEKITQLFLNPENYSPEQIPDVEELKQITKDPYSFKIILQLILQDINSIKKIKLKIENDIENMDQSAEKIIEQMKYLRKVLVKLNVPEQVQIKMIKKEIEEGVFKIITESVSYCTEKVKRNLELSIQKTLKTN